MRPAHEQPKRAPEFQNNAVTHDRGDQGPPDQVDDLTNGVGSAPPFLPLPDFPEKRRTKKDLPSQAIGFASECPMIAEGLRPNRVQVERLPKRPPGLVG